MRDPMMIACVVAIAISQTACGQRKRNVTYIDPAKAGPDFKVQGEYVPVAKNQEGKIAAQVVALGGGKFDLYILGGGLPGAGWDTKTRSRVSGKTDSEGTTTFQAKGTECKIADGKMTLNYDGSTVKLGKIHRKSKTEGAKAPKGAIVLFDGKNTDAWNGGKIVAGDLLHSGTRSKKPYLVKKIHLEFRTPFRPYGRGQGRGNSGTYINGREIQVLDSFALEGKRNECGALYGLAAPRINMCFPPLSWQTFDAEYKLDKKGQVVATIWHNGVKVHDNVNFRRGGNPQTIYLQAHGNPVYYRNIWLVEMKK